MNEIDILDVIRDHRAIFTYDPFVDEQIFVYLCACGEQGRSTSKVKLYDEHEAHLANVVVNEYVGQTVDRLIE